MTMDSRAPQLPAGLVPLEGTTGATTPSLLFRTAASYAMSAQMLVDQGSDSWLEDEKTPAIYLLGCFSLELSLKSFVLARDPNPKTIRNLSHDLKAAWAKAKGLGFDPDSIQMPADHIPWLIEELGPHHKGTTLRYMPQAQPFRMPAPEELTAGAINLCTAIKKHIAKELA